MANAGVAPPDYTTNVGLVRLYLGDTDPTGVASGEGTYLWYSDVELGAFLGQYGDNPRRVAIRILRNIAINQSLLLKKWTSQDLEVDGAAITEALLKAAKDLEDEEAAIAGTDASDIFQLVQVGGPSRTARALMGLPTDPLFPEGPMTGWPVS